MNKHLAIFKGEAAELILQGKKTVESRFSKSKIPPFGKVSAGDLVYIKPSGEEIIGQFRIKKVIFYDGLTQDDVLLIKKVYEKELAVSDDYWKNKMDAKYGSLIFISSSYRFITAPFKFPKKDLRGWVIL